MSSSERWKPIFVIFIFSFGFFEFSQIPFTGDSEIESTIPAAQHRIKKSVSRRSIDDTQPPVEISANAGSASDVPRSKRRLKKNNPYYESERDEDDLMGLKDRLKSDAAYADEGLKQSEKMVGSDLFKSSNQDKFDKNAIRRKRQGSPGHFRDRNELEFVSDSSEKLYNIKPRSGRVKRTFGWLFGNHYNNQYKPTTTTEAPRKSSEEIALG